MSWDKIAILGVGLLGGSLGLALRERKAARKIIGYVRREASMAECEKYHVVDQATLDLEEAVREADIVILTTPLPVMGTLVSNFRLALKPGAVVTDVGSVKVPVVAELEPLLADTQASFIGGHPMAGSEKTGPQQAQTDLFTGAICIVTPTPKSSGTATATVRRLWETVGSMVIELSPREHDELVARSSHLPHLLASQLVRYVLNSQHSKFQPLVCAGGFRDTTRIASGDPEMWADILLANSDFICAALQGYQTELEHVVKALESGDRTGILKFLQEAKQMRDRWCRSRDQARGSLGPG